MNLPRLIIVEGPDGAGKTTLVKELEMIYERSDQFTQVRVVHHGPYKGEEKIASRYFTPMARTIVEGTTALIMDRSWLSEPVYADALDRGAPRISLEEDRMLSRAALALECKVILCMPPYDVCAANRPEDTDFLADVYAGYLNMGTLMESDALNFGSHGSRWIEIGCHLDAQVYDYTKNIPLNLDRRYHNNGPGSGYYDGESVLMVGDRPNTARNGELKHRLPFVSFGRRDGCSWWLSGKLNESNINERDLYWINAYDQAGSATSARFMYELTPRAVVLLGTNAMKWWKLEGCHAAKQIDIDMPIYEEYHPQAWRRFHGNEDYNVTKILKEIVR